MFYNPTELKRFGVSLICEGKLGWEHGGVTSGPGGVDLITAAYTLSHMTLLDSLLSTACRRGIIRSMSKSSTSSAGTILDRS